MPCHTEPTAEEEYNAWENRLRHNSPTATALCELCAACEEAKFALPPLAQGWWEEHKQRDRRRVEREIRASQDSVMRQQALEKLTPYEKRLLGITT